MQTIDPIAAAERQAEIAKLMARLALGKQRLVRVLVSGLLTPADFVAVRRLNAGSHPVLAGHWIDFLALPVDDQVAALAQERFNGMSWQSLMQANPFVQTLAWKQTP